MNGDRNRGRRAPGWATLPAAALLACAGAAEPRPAAQAWANEGRWPRGPRAVASTPEKQFEAGERQERLGAPRQAAEAFRLVAEEYPWAEGVRDQVGRPRLFSEEARLRAAENLTRSGDLGKAREQVEELERFYPLQTEGDRVFRTPKLLDLYGRVLTGLGRAYLEGRGEGGTYSLRSRLRKARLLFRKVLDTDPEGRWADDAYLGLGECEEALGCWRTARDHYQKLTEQFPESEQRPRAEGRIAHCLDRMEPRPAYSEAEVEEARRRILLQRQARPDADLAGLGEDVALLDIRQARKRFENGLFYAINGHYRAAEVYFEMVRERHPDTVWAEKAAEELEKLRRR